MKRERAVVILLAAAFCLAGLLLLLGGMCLWVEAEGTKQNIILELEEAGNRETADIVGNVIEESLSIENLREEFASVPIVSWKEYCKVNMTWEISENQFIAYAGVTIPSFYLSKEEAGLRGLKEVQRIFSETMEGMCVVMVPKKAIDAWYGYITNRNSEGKGEGCAKSYTFLMKAVTGEILMLRRGYTEIPAENDSAIKLEDKELIELAKQYAALYQIGNVSEMEAYKTYCIWGSSYAEDGSNLGTRRVVFTQNGKEIFGILLTSRTGQMIGYYYDENKMNYIYQMGMLRDEIGYVKRAIAIAENIQEDLDYLEEVIEEAKQLVEDMEEWNKSWN